MEFHAKLALLIERCPKTQAQIAKETGIDPSAISAMMRGGRRPYMDQAFRLAKSLGTSLDYLADESLDEPSAAVDHAPGEVSPRQVLSRLGQLMTPDEAEAKLIRFSSMTKTEATVICLRHGIGGQPYSLAETAKIFRFTKERIRQIENSATKKLNEFMAF